MASKRRQRRKSCDGKVRYATENAAKSAAYQLAQLHGERMNAYKCQFCGGWHAGHTPAKVRRIVDRFNG